MIAVSRKGLGLVGKVWFVCLSSEIHCVVVFRLCCSVVEFCGRTLGGLVPCFIGVGPRIVGPCVVLVVGLSLAWCDCVGLWVGGKRGRGRRGGGCDGR